MFDTIRKVVNMVFGKEEEIFDHSMVAFHIDEARNSIQILINEIDMIDALLKDTKPIDYELFKREKIKKVGELLVVCHRKLQYLGDRGPPSLAGKVTHWQMNLLANVAHLKSDEAAIKTIQTLLKPIKIHLESLQKELGSARVTYARKAA